jgi:hypothetical protein
MFGLKKKKESKGLPDFPQENSPPNMRNYTRPQINSIPLDTDDDRVHSLPSFPDSAMNKGFSQTAIKDAIEDPQNNSLPPIPSNNDSKVVEMEEWEPSIPTPPKEMKPLRHNPLPMDEIPNEEMPIQDHVHQRMNPQEFTPQIKIKNQENNPNKPIFIKLEKFKETKKSLDEIKKRVSEMDELLKLIKEVKAKENEEISEWEKELEKVKARIHAVNSNIFENAY